MFSNKKFLVLIFLMAAANPAYSGYDEALDMINKGDFIEAIEELKPLVELGYPPALYQQATLYENGQGVQRDQSKAFELYQRAAGRGIAEAQFAIAQMYLEGRGCTKDTTQGFEYTRRAADKGLAAAQYNLALMYQKGEVITQSYRNAAIWYEDAAMQNFALAQFNLALLYFDGLGVTKDIEKSYIWNRVAAFNGYDPAEKSMNMDSKSLSREQIKSARERADELYLKISPDEQNYKPFSFEG
ncbi:tetratricopeptide repeat protein [Thalassotalea psychrophila]|uniref:Tetratricopeptide repeat protein n=1 Tax=Thalassotalea psychrophila TaxID=3065647 RepID=A0ABY9TXG2_9GAMM|nr:tetratricopeptide repeat protein [Colwelliaceae bacterium SQ149]